MPETLLPCPFCGVVPELCEDNSYDACLIGCHCEAEPCVMGKKDAADVVIRIWNTRAPLASLQPSVSEMRMREALEEADYQINVAIEDGLSNGAVKWREGLNKLRDVIRSALSPEGEP